MDSGGGVRNNVSNNVAKYDKTLILFNNSKSCIRESNKLMANLDHVFVTSLLASLLNIT